MATDYSDVIPVFEGFDEQLDLVQGTAFKMGWGGATLGAAIGGDTGAIIGGALGFLVGSAEERDQREKTQKQLLSAIYGLASHRRAIAENCDKADKDIDKLEHNIDKIVYCFSNSDGTSDGVLVSECYETISRLYRAIYTKWKGKKVVDFLDNWQSKFNNMKLEDFIAYARDATYLNYRITWTDAYDTFYNVVKEHLEDSFEKDPSLLNRFNTIMSLVVSYVPINSLEWKNCEESPFTQMQKNLIENCPNASLCGKPYQIYKDKIPTKKSLDQTISDLNIKKQRLERKIKRDEKIKIIATCIVVALFSVPLLIPSTRGILLLPYKAILSIFNFIHINIRRDLLRVLVKGTFISIVIPLVVWLIMCIIIKIKGGKNDKTDKRLKIIKKCIMIVSFIPLAMFIIANCGYYIEGNNDGFFSRLFWSVIVPLFVWFEMYCVVEMERKKAYTEIPNELKPLENKLQDYIGDNLFSDESYKYWGVQELKRPVGYQPPYDIPN